MEVQAIKIIETRNIILFGTARISGIDVLFSYDERSDKFTAIVYDKYKASGIFDEGGRDVPQEYLVGRIIRPALKSLINKQ